MAEARFTVGFAGPYVTVQDGGRPNKMRFGVPHSGGMDRAALAIANVAVGNPAGAPLIEVSMGGLQLACTSGEVTVAVVGGGFIVEAGERHGSWVTLTVKAGERLVIRPGPWGSWTYLAFAGNLQTGHWLDSAATHALSGLGGGKIAAGQSLTVTDARAGTGGPQRLPCPVWARPRHIAHVVMGPQDRHFTKTALGEFTSVPFYMSSAYDRMGIRLDGPKLGLLGALSIPSEPIVRGSVQVTGAGVATLLMADHQTTGGYPKIATVLSCDLDAIAQLRPRDPILFVPVRPEEAVQKARMHQARLSDYLTRLAAGAPDLPASGQAAPVRQG